MKRGNTLKNTEGQSKRGGGLKYLQKKRKDDKRKTRKCSCQIRKGGGEGGDEGSPISFLPTEPASLPRSRQ